MRAAHQALTLASLSLLLAGAARADEADPPPAGTEPGERVVITGTRAGGDYRTPAVDSTGPLGAAPLLDQPYSIGVLPRGIIESSQAVNFKDVSKYLPLVAYQEQHGPDILRPQARGMQGGNFQNSRLDGMTMFVTVANAMEQFEQIEVVNGLSASLYGPANPAGMFNFVSKRPTQEPLHEVTATYLSDAIGTAKVDFGGRIDPGGIVSYRLNALYGSGDGYVEGSHNRRVLGDLGIDVRPWAHAVLELNYSDYSLRNTGYPGWFSYGQGIHLPAAPDPEQPGYGQSYAGVDMRTRIAEARFRQDLGPSWHLVVGVLNQDAFRSINTPVNNLANDGSYVSSFANGFAPRFVITSDSAYLNGTFSTFGIGHDLTLGTAGYRASSYAVNTAASAASVRLGAAAIGDPQIFPEPPQGPPNSNLNHDGSDTYQQGFNLSDTLRLDDRWSVRAGASQDWFHVNNFNGSGALTSVYRNHGISPSGSVLFKPVPSITTYVTWASSLQSGDLAPGTAANAGVSLPAYRSREYEIGYKQQLAGIDLAAALFRIERPFATIDPLDGVFKITGQQVNKGLELSAIGNVLAGLKLYGGLTLLDARLEHTALATTNDRTYVGAAKVKGNLLFEYDVPGVQGLVASLDYQFSSARAANDTNSFSVSGYQLFDIGAHYTSTLWNRPVTFRLSIDNVTNRRYWSTVAPSNLTGANTGSLLAHLGSPRMVLAGITLDL